MADSAEAVVFMFNCRTVCWEKGIVSAHSISDFDNRSRNPNFCDLCAVPTEWFLEPMPIYNYGIMLIAMIGLLTNCTVIFYSFKSKRLTHDMTFKYFFGNLATCDSLFCLARVNFVIVGSIFYVMEWKTNIIWCSLQ